MKIELCTKIEREHNFYERPKKGKYCMTVGRDEESTYEPFAVALQPFDVEELNGDGLRLEPGFQPVLQIPLMNPAEAAFPE